MPESEPILNKVEDERGLFEELAKSKEHGQVSIFTINFRQVRGKHYHKKTTEIFTVIEGSCICELNDESILLREGDAIKITPENRHSFQNPYNEICKVLLWRPDIFNSEDVDTYI